MNDKKLLVQLTEEELREIIKASIKEVIDGNKSYQKSKDILTSKEVLSLLGISISTLYAWKRDGKIPFFRLNGRIYFKYDDIIQLLTDAGNTKAMELQRNFLSRRSYA